MTLLWFWNQLGRVLQTIYMQGAWWSLSCHQWNCLQQSNILIDITIVLILFDVQTLWGWWEGQIKRVEVPNWNLITVKINPWILLSGLLLGFDCCYVLFLLGYISAVPCQGLKQWCGDVQVGTRFSRRQGCTPVETPSLSQAYYTFLGHAFV
jgi:hypothetical protein